MSTHLYLSPAASGKTRWVIDALRASAAGLRGTPIAVVATPLQASSLRRRLAQAGGALGVHILTFDELYVLLLHHCGEIYTELAEPVRYRLLREVIATAGKAGRLPFYGGLAASPGFVDVVQGLIGLFKGAAIAAETLAASLMAAFPADGAESARLGELNALYADYQQLLQAHNWSDRAGMGWLALEAVQGCSQPLPSGIKLVAFDGFDDFTQIQLQVMAALAAKLPDMVVTLTGDPDAANGQTEARPDQRLYIRTARQVGKTLGVRAEPLPVQTPSPSPQVEMIEVTNQAAEVRAALRWLKQRIVHDGCRPHEVALLARSIQPYRETVVQIAAEFGIALRILDGLPLAQNPVIAALLALLRLALPAEDGVGLDLARRDVLEAWRSPYFDWSGGDADLLAAVALDGRVLRGESQWRSALEQAMRRGAVPDEDAETADRIAASEIGKLTERFNYFVDLITPLSAARTFVDFTQWLEQLIGDVGQPADDAQAEQQAQATGTDRSLHILACVCAGSPATAARDMAALRTFKDVLRGLIWAEAAAGELGEAQPPISYSQFFDELIGATGVTSYLPPVGQEEAVLVATAAQVRGVPLNAVAVMGLAEGEFPARIGEDPFLRDADRLRLQAQGLPLDLSTTSHERELFADCLARADMRLLVTRPRLAEGGAEWEPSPYWHDVRRRFHVQPVRLQDNDSSQPPASAHELVERLARLQTPMPVGQTWLEAAFPGRWRRVEHGAHVTQQRHRRQASPYDGDLAVMAGRLTSDYGPAHIWSPSRLESYLTCSYFFFIGHILKLEPRPEPSEGLDGAQLGSIYHRIFERACQAVVDAGDLSALLAAASDVTDEVLRDAPQEFGFRATAWWEQECVAIRSRVQQTLAGLAATDASSYQPIAFEQFFGAGENMLTIAAGQETVRVRGVIDRIDRHVVTGNLRIVDYKTGSSGFDARSLQEGKKLQLPIYALAAQQALGLGEVEEGFYWLIQHGEPSPLRLSRWEGGPAAAIATAAAHILRAVQGVRDGQFASHPPADGCPSYCPAAAFCVRYRER